VKMMIQLYEWAIFVLSNEQIPRFKIEFNTEVISIFSFQNG
jgi:hypothetical protein